MRPFGHHINRRQKHRIYLVIGGLALLGLILGLALSGASQNAPRHPQNAPSATLPINPTAHPSSTTTIPIAAGHGVIAPHSSTPRSAGILTPQTPAAAGIPTTTTTTVANGSAGTSQTVVYAANVDPRFHQDPKNPLSVMYSYSATASTVINGVSLQLSSLPEGSLSLSVGGNVKCAMNVGGTVAGGTCVIVYPAFGEESVTATYGVNGYSYRSPIVSDNVQPFSTTIIASIKGGGNLGGLEFDANVTDSNGNAVTTGSVSMVISDRTQGWSYSVSVQGVGGDGANPNIFSCIFGENLPRVGEYQGCNPFSGPIVITPQSGDTLTTTATFLGTLNWDKSISGETTYTMP